MRRWCVLLPACLLLACSGRPKAGGERQITSGIGVKQSPALSRDGTLVAFAASPDGQSNPQLWVTRVDGSTPPLRLTDDPSQNYDPEFSPDGRSVYFTSTRQPQGLYRIPVSGGAPELILPQAVSARIAPDGKTFIYGVAGKLYRRAMDGSAATELLPEVDNSYAPIWSPDGARVLVTAKNRDERDPHWWIVPLSGDKPIKTSFVADLRAQAFNSVLANGWSPGNWIVFTGKQGERRTVWKAQVGPDGEHLGLATRATGSAEGDYAASFAAGKLVFARTRVDMNLWALPLDPSGEHLAKPPEQLTSSPVRKGQESAAGSRLLYSAENGERFTLFLKDGEKERPLRDAFFSSISPDGRRYVYAEGAEERLKLLQKSVSWWPFWSSTLCENCGMPRGFSSDAKKLLLWPHSPPIQHLDILDVPTRRVSRVVWAGSELSGPQLSPDGRFVSFVANAGDHKWQTFIAPVWQEKLLGSFDWAPVGPASDSFHFAFWSARGDLLYTLTARGPGENLRWLEAQRLDVENKRAIGSALPVYEFPEMLVPGMDPLWNTIAVTRDRIILQLGGMSTNIWIR